MNVNMIGSTYGRLTILSYVGIVKSKKNWVCKCICGKEIEASTGSLRSGNTSSCGCYQKETRGEHVITHNLSSTPEYNIWKGILYRCNNTKSKDYFKYGGRGITVCSEWLDVEQFYKDMGKSNGLQIDRIDNNKGYYKENCRWATIQEQARNRNNNNILTYNNISKCLAEWCVIFNMAESTLRNRLAKGMSVVDALTTPTKVRTVK
jgi:hypothetical protein